MRRPQQAISLSAATARIKVMAGKYGKYPWNFSVEQEEYLRSLSPMPSDLVEALTGYDRALSAWRETERAMATAARPAPAGAKEELR